MCLNPMRREDGFLMPLSLFILVGLASLAIAISRLSSGSFHASVQTSVATQSFYAADSAAQYAMNQLLFNAANRTEVDARCIAVSGALLNFNVAGLKNCSANLSCTTVANAGGPAAIYDITSNAQCGGGELVSERSIVVRAIYDE